jgi:hypothetical protein
MVSQTRVAVWLMAMSSCECFGVRSLSLKTIMQAVSVDRHPAKEGGGLRAGKEKAS